MIELGYRKYSLLQLALGWRNGNTFVVSSSDTSCSAQTSLPASLPFTESFIPQTRNAAPSARISEDDLRIIISIPDHRFDPAGWSYYGCSLSHTFTRTTLS